MDRISGVSSLIIHQLFPPLIMTRQLFVLSFVVVVDPPEFVFRPWLVRPPIFPFALVPPLLIPFFVY